MSGDIVDDLHAAEDHIGVLEQALRQMIDARGRRQFRRQRSAAVVALGDGYCRASCENGECDELCGCQAHGDDPHPGWVVDAVCVCGRQISWENYAERATPGWVHDVPVLADVPDTDHVIEPNDAGWRLTEIGAWS